MSIDILGWNVPLVFLGAVLVLVAVVLVVYWAASRG
jgi:hypothetical protein